MNEIETERDPVTPDAVITNYENSSTRLRRVTNGSSGCWDEDGSELNMNVEEKPKFEVPGQKTASLRPTQTIHSEHNIGSANPRRYQQQKLTHTFLKKSDIGSANLQSSNKMPTSAKLKSSFKPRITFKYCRETEISNNSKILDYFKMESKPNMDLHRQNEPDPSDLTDFPIVDNQ